MNGAAVAIVGLAAGWSVDPGTGVLALLAPLLMFGLPAAAWRAWRQRSWRAAALLLAAWASAACVPLLAVTPIG